MNFNPDILKNYSNRQLDQLSRAGSNADIGTEQIPDRIQSSGLSRASVFSRLFRRPDPSELENVEIFTPSNDEADITDLDESSRYSQSQSRNVSEVQPVIIDEDSRNSIDVEWDKLPDECEENDTRLDIFETRTVEISTLGNSDEPEESIPNDPEPAIPSADNIEPAVTLTAEVDTDSIKSEANRIRTMKKHEILLPCQCEKLKCSSNISEEERRRIWTHYWSLSYPYRKHWLKMNMSKKSIGRHTGTSAGKQKLVSWSYQLAGKRVCKSMFLRTLGYTSDKVLTVTRMNDTIEDGRGKGINPSNKISENEIRRIKDHIEVVYEPNVSHYRQEHAPKRRYLDSCLKINGMHKRYKEDFGGQPISYSFFRKILSDMNISFTKLGHEQCEGCLTHEEHKCAPPNVECPEEVCEDCCNYEEHVKNSEYFSFILINLVTDNVILFYYYNQ